jgi:hypothetical protein
LPVSVPKQKSAVFQAASGGDDRRAVLSQFANRAVGADGIAGEYEKRVIALAEQAFEQRILLAQFPFLRHPIIGGAELEILHGVLTGLFPSREIGMRTSRNERDLRRIGGRGGGRPSRERQTGCGKHFQRGL